MSGINLPSTNQCKWAEGDSGNYTFPCKNQKLDGSSYCAYHAAIVYETPEQRKARAEQARIANAAAKRIAA